MEYPKNTISNKYFWLQNIWKLFTLVTYYNIIVSTSIELRTFHMRKYHSDVVLLKAGPRPSGPWPGTARWPGDPDSFVVQR